jgi:hypothetical protein
LVKSKFLVELPMEPHRKNKLLEQVLRQLQEQRGEVEPGLTIYGML